MWKRSGRGMQIKHWKSALKGEKVKRRSVFMLHNVDNRVAYCLSIRLISLSFLF